MDLPQSSPDTWETQAQVDEIRVALGLSRDQINRWRQAGLLPEVEQLPGKYHGSLVRYPLGTCHQIAAAARLFKIKNRVPYVGWQLWWQGYAVDEKYWRPRLQERARFADRVLARLAKYLERDEQKPRKQTLQERIAHSSVTNTVMSRVRGRQSGQALATTLGTVLQVARGEFDQFSVADAAVEGDNADKNRTIEALDIDASQTDRIFGNRLELVRELPGVFADISRSNATGSLSQILTQPDHVIFRARDDMRNALRTYVAMYKSMRWIYGPTAFGLRLGAWIGRKQPEWLIPLAIIGFARLQQVSNQLLTSEEIAKLAEQAETNAKMFLQIRQLARMRPEFRNVFAARSLRAAFQNTQAMEQHLKKVAEARDSA